MSYVPAPPAAQPLHSTQDSTQATGVVLDGSGTNGDPTAVTVGFKCHNHRFLTLVLECRGAGGSYNAELWRKYNVASDLAGGGWVRDDDFALLAVTTATGLEARDVVLLGADEVYVEVTVAGGGTAFVRGQTRSY